MNNPLHASFTLSLFILTPLSFLTPISPLSPLSSAWAMCWAAARLFWQRSPPPPLPLLSSTPPSHPSGQPGRCAGRRFDFADDPNPLLLPPSTIGQPWRRSWRWLDSSGRQPEGGGDDGGDEHSAPGAAAAAVRGEAFVGGALPSEGGSVCAEGQAVTSSTQPLGQQQRQ